jgi:hypothetical protein
MVGRGLSKFKVGIMLPVLLTGTGKELGDVVVAVIDMVGDTDGGGRLKFTFLETLVGVVG